MECMEGGSNDTCDGPSAKRVCREEQHSLDPQALRHAILHTIQEPVVFRGYLAPSREGGRGGGGGWPCLAWPLDQWADMFGEEQLELRVAQRTAPGMALAGPQWEGQCLKAKMTLGAFLAWAQGPTPTTTTTTCGTKVTSTTHWAYFDYYYLRRLAQGCLDLDWGALGFPERSTADSTLWIGSTGANTPCHIDTYGINLVAQVHGYKRWVLFPECQSKSMDATRVPYEESSIYSNASFPYPSRHSHPALALTTPHVVTLGPGDVLFVPRRWWHSVENLSLAVSVNTWLEVEEDAAERVKEAIVMFQVASLCSGVTTLSLLEKIFNPNMYEVAAMTPTDLLAQLLRQVTAARHSISGTSDGEKHQPKDHSAKDTGQESATQGYSSASACPVQHNRLSGTEESHGQSISKCHSSTQDNWRDRDWLAQFGITPVPCMTFWEYQRDILGVKEKEENGKKKKMEVKKEEEEEEKENEEEEREKVEEENDEIEEKEKKKEKRGKEEEECYTECQYRGVLNSANSEDEKDLKLLIDVFTDTRVVSLMKEVLDEKLRNVVGGGDSGGVL